MTETKKIVEAWNSLTSTTDRETYIRDYLIRLYLNTERRAFLQEFTTQFGGIERLKVLKLCRKILVQYPERIIDIDKGRFEAFKEEYLLEINNDIPIDGIKWIDEEISYVEFELSSESETKSFDERQNQILQTTTTPNVSDITTLMSKEETLTYFRISTSTFDRWRQRSFPCQKIGKKFFVDKRAAEDWIATNKPNKISFNSKFGKAKLRAA